MSSFFALLSSVWIWINSVLRPSSFESDALRRFNANSSNVQPNDFYLIGAGLQRTGTFSTRIALTRLLGGKCFHGFIGSMDEEGSEFWVRAAYGRVTDQEWKDFLLGQGYVSGVGEPISLFYDDLMKVFPNAKVILTRRPAEKWYASMQKAIIEPRGFLERPPVSWIFGAFGWHQAKEKMEIVRAKAAERRHLNHTSWTATAAGKDVAVKYFENWNQMIINTVPKDKLLVYDVREGWEPLCNFLGVPIPKEPFPQINDSVTIGWLISGAKVLLFLLIPCVVMCCLCRFSDLCYTLFMRCFGKISFPIVCCVTALCAKIRGKVAYSPLKSQLGIKSVDD